MKFGDMAHGQNNNSSHRPTKLRLEKTLSGFVHRKIIRLIQYSKNYGFWTRKSYAISWLHYSFYALNGCDIRIE